MILFLSDLSYLRTLTYALLLIGWRVRTFENIPMSALNSSASWLLVCVTFPLCLLYTPNEGDAWVPQQNLAHGPVGFAGLL